MRSKRVAVLMVLGLAAVTPVAMAAPAQLKVTGGGQIILDGAKGPGDTIAFTAQSIEAGSDFPDAARGELQYRQRVNGTDKVHGLVDCLVVTRGEEGQPDTAVIGGTIRNDPTGARFRVDVVDNGQGAMDGDDLVAFERVTDGNRDNCATQAAPERLPTLGRGNVTIHRERTASGSSGGAKAQQRSFAQAKRLAGMR